MILADRIRTFVIQNRIAPARAKGARTVQIRAGDVHTDLGLNNRMPAVCSALDAQKFLDQAKVTLVRREGPHQGGNAEWTFEI